jgi:uncharacterized protein YkwD
MRLLWRSMLVVLLCIVSGAAVASPSHADGPWTVRTTTTLSALQFESRLLARINLRRAHQGCRAFRTSAALQLAARRHSSRMAQERQLSHRLPGEADLGTRVARAGYTSWRIVAENLAWGQASPRAVFRTWVRSSGHRANLDNCRLRDIGVGVVIRNARPWVTADFGRRVE